MKIRCPGQGRDGVGKAERLARPWGVAERENAAHGRLLLKLGLAGGKAVLAARRRT